MINLSKHKLSAAIAGILALQPLVVSAATDLYFSEYVEGSSNNKALELYNNTGAEVDLSAYEIQFYFNGSSTPGATLNLTGVVPDGEVFVVANSNAVADILDVADFTSSVGFFNGDDAITLLNGGVVVDVIGQIGVDPGSEWGAGDTSTQNNTLRRQAAVADGDTDPYDTFDPASQWVGFANDSFDNLGSYSSDPDDGGGDDGDASAGICGDTATLISVVQGTENTSPIVGDEVIVEGVVTGQRDGGFFIQEELKDEDGNAASSEGIFVLSNDTAESGHKVRVLGTVTESYGLTEIASVQDVVDCGTGEAVTQVQIAFPLSEGQTLEPYEGMVVSVNDLRVTNINNLWRYGEIGLSHALKVQPTELFAPGTEGYERVIEENNRNVIYVEDNSGSSYPERISYYPGFSYANPIRINDLVSASGPLNFSYGLYRINPQNDIVVLNDRESAPDLMPGNLSIASFNVLNYFNGQPTADGGVTFDYPENRGAENQEEFDLQKARIVEALIRLDSDIVGLMEIENDGFDNVSAIQSLVDALNINMSEDDAYSFIATADASPVGSDAIAVGLIYRSSVVTPTGNAAKIPMPIQDLGNGETQKMRTALLQSFRHIETGQEVAVVVNHLKSKGSKCFEDLNSPSQIDSAQGSCNALRVSAAVTLGNALAEADLPERVMILGDLNSYSAEDPIAVLTDYDPAERGYTIKTAVNTDADKGTSVEVTETFGYVNVAEAFDPEGFSYWYYDSGQIGSLDHILVNTALLEDVIDATHWNINAPEAYQLQYDQALTHYRDEDGYAFTDIGPFRSSDHDPFIVSFNLPMTAAPGDFNRDGKIDIYDLLALFKQLFQKVTDENRQYDLNGDCRINVWDLMAFLRLL
ncbi:ExeM/NucH family extracellular endonuclease [Hahella ganghwensis]|uniref:ExeM/NucH family extracellular endonuclease n=1 Tax=Hahella ganghwensis TaxID=286420 RepID=UPI0003627E2C|nr:ExeM/NucH family extracellular endonuclease [Hahella ganghwensis]